MGGNALKTVYTRRYNRAEYFNLFNEIKFLATQSRLAYYFKLLPAYKNKQTFGDMDILIHKGFMKKDIKFITDTFHPTEIYNNGNVVSFDYKELQIDFIFVADEYFNTSLTYYSYNDLGNLMGRIANRMGVRYGHEGLKRVEYGENKNRVIAEIVLSKNLRKIFEFLGFNYDRYLEGFNELEDIFKYVIDSEFFSKNIFAYESLNHENRTRNKKRKTYREFLEYIQDLETDDYDFNNKENYFLNRMNEYFPDAKIFDVVAEAKERESRKNLIKEKFNGEIVMKITNLSGILLGEFIAFFKDRSIDFENFILKSDADTISKGIHRIFVDFQNRTDFKNY